MPVCFPPALDELLSSLIRRHAVFYNVPPLAVLHHSVPNLRSLKAADRDLTQDQAEALAIMFRTTATAVFGMTFAIAPGATRRLISSRVMQECQTCLRIPTKPAMHSNLKPAGSSDLKPATLGVIRMGRGDDVLRFVEGQAAG